AGVVGQGADAVGVEPLGGVLQLAAGQAIDNPRVSGVFLPEKLQELLARVLLLGNAVLDIGPVKAADKLAGLAQGEALDNLGPGAGVGGGRQGNAGDLGKVLVQQAQLQVISPKVMAPLGHAVGFVDGKQRNGRAAQ